MSIYITGDTHGEYGRIAELDSTLKEGDYLIVCGDWGYIFTDSFSERRLLDDLEARPYTILFIDGNHEKFPAIYSYPEEMWCGGKIHRIRDNIIHLCRGQVFEIEELKFFTFGGGCSADKMSRVEGLSWWKEELPNQEEYDEGKRNLQAHNWSVDYILTHTLNTESIKVLASMDKYNTTKPLLADEAMLNSYLEDIRKFTKYKEWFFGHFHKDKRIEYTRQTGVWFDMIRLN